MCRQVQAVQSKKRLLTQRKEYTGLFFFKGNSEKNYHLLGFLIGLDLVWEELGITSGVNRVSEIAKGASVLSNEVLSPSSEVSGS